MRFIFGPLIIVLGVLMMKYTVQITETTGKIDFAEKYLKGGLAGTYTWWRLFGLFLIIISMLWMAGTLSLGTIDTNLTP
jgi:hypothetical protein